jgi:hypothetical protein
MVDGLMLAPAEMSGQWIWTADEVTPAGATVPAKQPRFFRKTFELTRVPLGPVTLDVSCDDTFAAFVNGEAVNLAVPEFYNERVYSCDVTKSLRLGKNVIAVRAENRPDPLDETVGTPAGLFVNLTDRSDAEPRRLATTDDAWKAGKDGPEGWAKAEFDDASWPKAKALAVQTAAGPWARMTWDAEVNRQLAARNWTALPLALGGNIRNHASWEGYPVLDARRAFVENPKLTPIPRDPADEQFLLYPPSHALMRAGLDQKPAGVRGR